MEFIECDLFIHLLYFQVYFYLAFMVFHSISKILIW